MHHLPAIGLTGARPVPQDWDAPRGEYRIGLLNRTQVRWSGIEPVTCNPTAVILVSRTQVTPGHEADYSTFVASLPGISSFPPVRE